jgi:4-hydroxybenzoate polyprenyltransferase
MLARLVHISRPVLWINTVGTGVVGMWLSGSLWNVGALPLLLWLTLPFNLLIYGVNDLFDRDTDDANPRKGSMQGARITSADVPLIVRGVVVTNVPFLLYFLVALPASANLWIALCTLIFIGYSAPPLRFKARPVLDSLSNAAYAFPLVIVPLAIGQPVVWWAALGLMAWSAAKHTFDAVQDIDDDARAGLLTTAVVLRERGVVVWCGVLWAAASVAFALVNVPVALVNAVLAGALVASLSSNPTPAMGQRLYRYSIAFPYVAGTVAGVQLVAALARGMYP